MNNRIIVNGEMVGPGILDQEMRRLSVHEPYLQQNEMITRAKNNVVDQMLLKQEALDIITTVAENLVEGRLNQIKENFGGEENFYKQNNLSSKDDPMIKKDLEIQLKVEMFIDEIAKNVAPPPEHVVKEFYNRDRDNTFQHEQIHAAHIVKQVDQKNPLKTYNEMKKIRQQLKEGADFAQLADKNSSCNDKGGDMGFFARGQMVEEFDVVAFSMDAGEISPIFQTQFGYHIATVYDKKPEKRLSYEECKDNLKQVIFSKLREQAVDKWLEKARAKADIQL